eukprot:CFRG5736T1
MTAANKSSTLKVAVVGGGVAGSTIALRLCEMGVNVTLVEKGLGLVNGPPMCHLHAGGNLYREISDKQCLKLLQQSIETVRIYPSCINVRPTVITVPLIDIGMPLDLLPRLRLLQKAYKNLVVDDPRNKVLGEPANYFRLYERSEMDELAKRPTPTRPLCNDDWIIPVAKEVDLDKLKFPVLLVQEYGLSSLRIAATAELTLKSLPNCDLLTQTKLTRVKPIGNGKNGWSLTCERERVGEISEVTKFECDYLVNATGYRTGSVDDMSGYSRTRFVEFKAAYVTKWNGAGAIWPEVIFHGERGTPHGMAQITPYPDGYYQLHGMTKDITLFKGGLVTSTPDSAQPQLPEHLERKITKGWEKEELVGKANAAIAHLSWFIRSFETAECGGKPLYGAQQIPGTDASMRASSVSFEEYYARAEIVKASSALTAANEIVEELKGLNLLDMNIDRDMCLEELFATSLSLSHESIEAKACMLAVQRNYPIAIAKPYTYKSQDTNLQISGGKTTVNKRNSVTKRWSVPSLRHQLAHMNIEVS